MLEALAFYLTQQNHCAPSLYHLEALSCSESCGKANDTGLNMLQQEEDRTAACNAGGGAAPSEAKDEYLGVLWSRGTKKGVATCLRMQSFA